MVELKKLYTVELVPLAAVDWLADTDDVTRDAVVPDAVAMVADVSLGLESEPVAGSEDKVLREKLIGDVDCDCVLIMVGCPVEGPENVVVFESGNGAELKIRVEELISLALGVEVLPKTLSLLLMD